MHHLTWIEAKKFGAVGDNSGKFLNLTDKPKVPGLEFNDLYYDLPFTRKIVVGGSEREMASSEAKLCDEFIRLFKWNGQKTHAVDNLGRPRGLVMVAAMKPGWTAVEGPPPGLGFIYDTGKKVYTLAAGIDDKDRFVPFPDDVLALKAVFPADDASMLPPTNEARRWKYDFASAKWVDAREILAAKEQKRARIISSHEAARAKAWGQYAPPFEAETWRIQLDEARNPDKPTPFLDTILAINGRDRAAFVQAILAKHEDFVRCMATHLGQQQVALSLVDACTTLSELDAIPVE